jgi:quercetin dioxygenase-like cupin family protein
LRVKEVDRRFHATSQGKKGNATRGDADEFDVVGPNMAVLESIGTMWTGLEGAKVEMRDHDYHVSLVLCLSGA